MSPVRVPAITNTHPITTISTTDSQPGRAGGRRPPAAGAFHPRAHRQHHKQVKKRTGVLRQSAQAWWWRFRPPDGRPMWAGESDSWASPLPWSVRSSIRRRRRFPSTFPPPDAGPRGTGWNKQGRRGTAETVDRLFVHVTSYCREQVGMGRDRRGDGGATCKIAGIAYTGSNPVPATLPLSCGNAAADRPVRPGSTLRFPSTGRPTEIAWVFRAAGPNTPSMSSAGGVASGRSARGGAEPRRRL